LKIHGLDYGSDFKIVDDNVEADYCVKVLFRVWQEVSQSRNPSSIDLVSIHFLPDHGSSFEAFSF